MTRMLIAILIALNVILYLWIHYGDASNKRDSAPQRKADFGAIQLLSEVTDERSSKAAEIPPAEVAPEAMMDVSADSGLQPELRSAPGPAPVPTSYCGELGPLRSKNMAEGYRKKLMQGDPGQVQVEARPGTEVVGYWVMTPPQADAASANAMLKSLKDAGFDDLWLLRKGEHKHAISLGLYTEKRFAQRHADNIRKKGFEPVVLPKEKATRTYWVIFEGIEESALKDLEDLKLPAGVSLQKKVCNQALTGP